MKFIGQHIVDLIARFRSSIYLEGVKTGTIASGGNLGLDSDNKIVKDSGVGATDLHGAGVDGAANQLLTDDGDGTVTSEPALSFTSSTLSMGNDNADGVIIKRQDHGDGSGGSLNLIGANGTGTNQSGGALKFYGGQGTGTGDGGDIEFWTAADGTAGSSLNGFGFLPRFKVDADGVTTISGDLNILGTIFSTGDATIFGNDIIFEGTSDDVHEATLSGGNPGSDITVTLPASTGTLALQNENTTGNAATVTTNANLTGHITSSGNAAVLGSFTIAQLSTAISNASISGNNTGDQTSVSGASGTVTSIGNLTGDVTSTNRATVIGTAKVTMAKLADVATDTFIGRTASGDGVPKALSKSEALAILNVADGSNANVATNLGITGDTAARVITSSTGTNVTIPVGTTSVSGLLTPSLFDEIDANTAKNTNVVTNLAITGSAAARTITSSDGTDAVIPLGTTSVSGLLSPALFDEIDANTAKISFPGFTTITETDVTITSATSTKPLFNLKSTTNDNKGSTIQFTSDKGGAGADDDIIGTIDFIGDNVGQTQTLFGKIQTRVETAANGDEAGKMRFMVSQSNSSTAANTTGLELIGHGTNSTISATIGHGAASVTTIAGDLKVTGNEIQDSGGNVVVSSNGSGVGQFTGSLSGDAGTVSSIGNLTGDVTSSNRATTIAADAVTYAKMQNVSATNVVLGRDSSGAGIVEEIAADKLRTIINVEDGATADQTNVTGSSGSCTGNAATATILASARAINGVDFNGSAPITITAAGSTLSNTVTVAKGGTGRTSLAANSLLTGDGTNAIVAESNFTYDGTNLKLASDGIAAPDFTIESTASHPTAGNLFFNKFRDDNSATDGMLIGLIHWNSEDDANNGQSYAQIIGSAEETGSGIEGGKLQFKIATHDGELKDAIVIEDGNAEDEIDITIGQGASSLTTIAGNLDVIGNVLPGITYVKILPSDFVPDDVGRPAMIDDTGSDRWLESHGTAKLFAFVEIPVGFKATVVDVYGSATSAVTVYEADINSKTVTSKGTGNIGTAINITDVNSDATNYILIELAQASGEEVYGGKLTIAKI